MTPTVEQAFWHVFGPWIGPMGALLVLGIIAAIVYQLLKQ